MMTRRKMSRDQEKRSHYNDSGENPEKSLHDSEKERDMTLEDVT